jgi:putative SOS response-associated peptidase YedK
MCGRVRLSSDVSEIKLVFSIPPHRPIPNFPPSWNAAPTDVLPVVRHDRKAGERSLDLLRWGLVPFWAKDLKVGFANINAKAEGIENKPAFRDAFQRRRCLVPVDSFYEWKKTPTGKQPYAVALADRSLMALAGLWENWRSPRGEWMRSFAIVTTRPNELCAELHNRMPVVLGPAAWYTAPRSVAWGRFGNRNTSFPRSVVSHPHKSRAGASGDAHDSDQAYGSRPCRRDGLDAHMAR